MQLSPLQSRLVASLVASIFILALYWLICSPNLALAADLPLRSDPELDVTLDLDQPLERTDPLQPSYEPEFGLFDRSIVGRQGVEAIPIEKDKPQRFTLKPGDPACYVLSKDDIFGTSNSRKRQTEHDDSEIEGNQSGGAEELTRRKNGDSKTVYVSATTCLQPHLTNPGAEAKTPSQLKLLASVSQDTGCPTTTEGMDKKMWKKFEEGLVQMTVSPDDNPVYVNIIAPEVSEDFAGPYDFELVMSLNSSYHQYNPASDVTPSLLWMDSDSSAALLLTGSLTDDESDTDRIKDMGPPYELYVENANWPVFDGIKRSLCGIEQQSLITANKDDDGRGNGLVRTSITTRGTGNLPKQEFYFEGLNQTSNYTAVLVQVAGFNDDALMAKRQEDNNGSGNRRYIVSKPMEFQTLKGTTCKVITDLDFCSETQWAVPGNVDLDGNEVAKIYDDYAKEMYSNFEKIMMQIPCETWTTSKYSLARDCDDCRDAYKRWLCTVAIPRCEDYSSPNKYSIVRNVGKPFPNGTLVPDEERDKLMKYRRYNESRNSFIDEKIKPGPYKEIMPCEELCYEVVQSCPAAIGFQCPLPGMTAFDYSYARRVDSEEVSCNYPGEPRTRDSRAGTAAPSMLLLGIASLGVLAAAL